VQEIHENWKVASAPSGLSTYLEHLLSALLIEHPKNESLHPNGPKRVLPNQERYQSSWTSNYVEVSSFGGKFVERYPIPSWIGQRKPLWLHYDSKTA